MSEGTYETAIGKFLVKTTDKSGIIEVKLHTDLGQLDVGRMKESDFRKLIKKHANGGKVDKKNS